MKRVALAFAVLLALTAGANAANWTVDYGKSKLWFEGKWSGEAFTAIFQKWAAVIAFDPANLPASKATITIDLSSVKGEEDDLTSGMKGPMGFAVAMFPQATFTTTSIKASAGNNYVASGNLSIHGVGKTVALPFTVTITGNSAHATGTLTVMRTDYKVGVGSSMGVDWGADTPVSHAIQIKFDLTATKQ